jgi:hypothetical protein
MTMYYVAVADKYEMWVEADSEEEVYEELTMKMGYLPTEIYVEEEE